MNSQRFAEDTAAFIFCGVACLLFAGCASDSNAPSMPRPGRGINEYREVTSEAYRAVAATVDSLQALAGNGNIETFDRAFNQLELTSITARARAEAIIGRGQSYFDEWHEQLAGKPSQPLAQANYNRLYSHFTIIRHRSSEVRDEFRPFMAGLRDFRAQLDHSGTAAKAPASPDEIGALTASGTRLLKKLESVSAALNDAEAELHAMLNSNS